MLGESWISHLHHMTKIGGAAFEGWATRRWVAFLRPETETSSKQMTNLEGPGIR